MRFHLRYQVYILTAALLLCGGSIFTSTASTGSKEIIFISGSGSSIGTMQLMAKSYQRKHPHVDVKVLPSIGSTGGIKAINKDVIDIGLTNRLLRPEEKSAQIIEEPYGRTAFVFAVQDSNPIKGLTLAEIEEIYSGKRQTWPDGMPIRLILRPLSDSYSAYLEGINPALKSASQKAHSIRGMFVGNTDQEASAQIEKTPGSFGTTSMSLIAAEKPKIKALSVDGSQPTLTNVSTGKYPYVHTLYIVYKKNKNRGAIKDFIEFVFSKDGQKLLSDNGLVTLSRITGK